MKLKYGIIGILIIIGIIIGFIVFHKKEKKIGSIKKFSYYYTNGYAMNDDTFYELNCTEDCFISIKPHGEEQENAHTIKVTNTFSEELEEILKKYHVGTWDNFHKNDPNVMDGDTFSINIEFTDNTTISASGYMLYSKNYHEVKKEIDTLFTKQLEKNKIDA